MAKPTAQKINLKIKRRADAGESWKYLGHGLVDNISRSKTLKKFTDDADLIAKECIAVFQSLGMIPQVWYLHYCGGDT